MTCSFSLIARYSLTFTRCSLLVARCNICSLLVAEVACCKKIIHYSLTKLLVAENHSLLVAEVARCRKSLATPCEIRSLFVAKKSIVTRCEICSLLVVKNHSSLKQSPAGIVCLKSTKLGESFSFFNIICFLRPKNSNLFQVNILR